MAPSDNDEIPDDPAATTAAADDAREDEADETDEADEAAEQAASPAEQADAPTGDAPSAGGSEAKASAPSASVAKPVETGDVRRVRAFIAVNLPLHATRRVADEIAALRKPIAEAGAKVQWVPAANLHVTVKFLGTVRAEAIEAIRGALARGLADRPPFELEARGMGAFPSLERPRVLWVGLREQPAFAALQKDIEAWMEAIGLPREARDFHPHLTIGRVSHAGPAGAIAPLLQAREATVFGGGRVTEVVLYESRTLARGAEYRPLARVPIG